MQLAEQRDGRPRELWEIRESNTLKELNSKATKNTLAKFDVQVDFINSHSESRKSRSYVFPAKLFVL